MKNSITTNAAGSIRTSNMTTLFDGKMLNAIDSNLIDIQGTGSHTFSENSILMEVDAGEYVVLQGKHSMPYFSGKVQVAELTMDSFALQSGIIKRCGYLTSGTVAPYDTGYDGFVFVSDGDAGEYRLDVWRGGTRTVANRWTAKEAMEDNDFDNFMVMFFEFLWLGGAALKLWFADQEGFTLQDSVHHVQKNRNTMIVSPNKSIRYEIRSTGGVGSFRYICSQVSTEGSINESGSSLAIRNEVEVAADAVNTKYILLAIRKKAGFLDTPIHIDSIGVAMEGTADAGILSLVKGGVVTGTLTFGDSASGKFEYASGNATQTLAGGRYINTIPVSQDGVSEKNERNFLTWLSSNLDGSVDTYYLVYNPITINQDCYGIMQVKEY